jgi:hypothetical protein
MLLQRANQRRIGLLTVPALTAAQDHAQATLFGAPFYLAQEA